MKISATMEKAIEEQDLDKIYSSFYTIALSDPEFSTGKFEEILRYIKNKNLPGFLKQYDGALLRSEEEWNEDYWNILLSELMDNFCEERIAQLKEVGKKIYGRNKNIEKPQPQNYEEEATEPKKTMNQSTMIIIAIIVIIVVLFIIFKQINP